MSDLEKFFGPPIFSYTRKMALEDRVLVHVPNRVYKYHTAVTAEVWGTVGPEKMEEFLVASVGSQVESWETGGIFEFEDNRYKVECGPGDEAEPVVTVMMPWED